MKSNTKEVGNKSVEDALSRILKSDQFGGAQRISEFLTYVVGEELAGRGDEIRGKTIAQDVYHKDPAAAGDPENIVRVDARRMRQLLDHYYETSGKSDPWRIHLDSGGYRPRFEEIGDDPPTSRVAGIGKSLLVPVSTFVAGATIGALLITNFSDDASLDAPEFEPSPIQTSGQFQERQAILEKSASSLQAVNLAIQARGMIFPIFDRYRQELITNAFDRVIELDPDYFGGYAGTAQTCAMLAIISPPGPKKQEYLQKTELMSKQALRLAPTEAWTQSALAWTAMARREFDRAYELSKRAVSLAPSDVHVLDFHGTIALFSGHFEEAAEVASRKNFQGGSNQRFANRNISGAANFHLGRYRQSLSSFEEAARFGDPISAPSFAYQAAAHNALGNRKNALKLMEQLDRSWPGAPIDVMLYSVHRDREAADQVLNQLRTVGWKSAVNTAITK